jgi:hypothetical protein
LDIGAVRRAAGLHSARAPMIENGERPWSSVDERTDVVEGSHALAPSSQNSSTSPTQHGKRGYIRLPKGTSRLSIKEILSALPTCWMVSTVAAILSRSSEIEQPSELYADLTATLIPALRIRQSQRNQAKF